MESNQLGIQKILKDFGYNTKIIEMADSTRTSADAAKVIRCDISQIAKSILFKEKSGKPVLVIASGSNRINEKIIEREIGEKVIKADANFVRDKTGFSIGGVPPFGHREKIQTFIDKDLMKYDNVWGAAGTSNSVFSINPKHLPELTMGKIISVN